MKHPIAAFVLAVLVTGTAFADLQPLPKSLQPVTDSSMVVVDRGAKLEVLATQRATSGLGNPNQRIAHRILPASSTAAIGPQQLGVVFNHALQARGYITGEISFKVKSGQAFSPDGADYPGLKRIIAPSVYIVNARTPAQFTKVLKHLQARTDLQWVEPTVTYESASGTTVDAQ